MFVAGILGMQLKGGDLVIEGFVCRDVLEGIVCMCSIVRAWREGFKH